MNKTELKEYYKEIEKLLICSRKDKSAFMSELKANIEDYISDTGKSDIESIKTEFGTPEVIAESFLSNANALAIRKKLNIKKCIIIGLIVALAVYIGFVIISLIDVHTEAHGYMEEGVVIINTLTGDDAS